MSLAHGGFRAVANIGDELAEIIERFVGAVDVIDAFAVDEEQMVAAITPGNVDIFAQLDIALGAENGQAPHRPRSAIRRE